MANGTVPESATPMLTPPGVSGDLIRKMAPKNIEITPRTIAREKIAPRAAEIDKTAEFPWDVVEAFRENELFGVLYDEEYGGIGESSLMALVVIEELSKVCATSGLIIAVQELGSLGSS